MKRILKTAIALLSAGAIATPLAAAEWGVSGQVRVNWDVDKSIEAKGKNSKEEGAEAKLDTGRVLVPGTGESIDSRVTKRTPNGVFIAQDDTWVAFTLTGEAANGGIYYYGDGARDYVGNVSAEDGNWAAAATITVQDKSNINGAESPRAGVTVNATKTGDHTVSLSHTSGFSVKIGRTTPLLTFSQGAGNLLHGHTGANAHVNTLSETKKTETDVKEGSLVVYKVHEPKVFKNDSAKLDALDNRSEVVDLGYKLSDSLKVGLALEQGDSGNGSLGSAFGSISYGNYSKKGTPSGFNYGIKANYSSDLVNVGLVVVSASEAGNKDLGGDENVKSSASAFGLGIGLSFGNLKPYFNLWKPSSKSEDESNSDETTSSTTQLGIDVALGESSGVGFSMVTSNTSYKAKEGTVEEEELKIGNSSIELGYVAKLGTADFKAGWVNITETAEQGDNKPEVAISWLRVRLQQSF